MTRARVGLGRDPQCWVGPPSGGQSVCGAKHVRLKPDLQQPQRVSSGFSLVEMVMVIVIISIAGVTLLSSFSNGGTAILVADQVQAGSGVARACGEHILRRHRDKKVVFASITTVNMNAECGALPQPSGYAPSVVVTTLTSGVDPCPSGASCKQVVIDAMAAGNSVNTVTFMVVDY